MARLARELGGAAELLERPEKRRVPGVAGRSAPPAADGVPYEKGA